MSYNETIRRGSSSGACDCSYYIEMLCSRYKDRGMATHVRADAALQERNEALTRALAPGAYVKTEEVTERSHDTYRNGNYRGTAYMTVNDFVNYFKAQRAYKSPTLSDGDAAAEEARGFVAVKEGNPPKKEVWLTKTDKLPAFIRKFLETPAGVKTNQLAAEWFPVENKVKKSGVRTKFPLGILASLVAFACALTMIISSSVMVSHVTTEISTLRNDIDSVQEEYDKLYSELEVKDNMLMIQKCAEEYGMVGSEYITSEYLDLSSEDGIKAYEPEEKSLFDLSSLLSAIGIK